MARRELHDTGGEGNEEASERGEPYHENARTRCSRGCGPANAEPTYYIEEYQVAKPDTSFESWGSRHVRRRLPERWPANKLNEQGDQVYFMSFRTAIAALRPLMPITLPPG